MPYSQGGSSSGPDSLDVSIVALSRLHVRTYLLALEALPHAQVPFDIVLLRRERIFKTATMSSPINNLTLASTVPFLAPDMHMPILGFSIYRVRASECASTCLAAIHAGYRHNDSAQLYNNEAEMGQAVRESGVPRAEVLLTTKIREPGITEVKL